MGGAMVHLRSAIVLAVLSLAGWALLLLPGTEVIWPGRDMGLPVFGIVVNLLLVATLIAVQRTHGVQPDSIRSQAVALVLATGALLLAGIVFDKVEAVPAALLLLCGGAALLIGLTAAEQLKDGRTVEVTSHWGGLGGSLGGWRISPLVITIMLALIFLGAAVTAGLDSSEGSGNTTVEEDGDTNTQAEDKEEREDKTADKEAADNEAAVDKAPPVEKAPAGKAKATDDDAGNEVTAGTNVSGGTAPGQVGG